MPTRYSADLIERSLAEGERFSDFAYLFDALVFLRQPYHQDRDRSEAIAGRILCFLMLLKPDDYIRAMQRYRLGFAGVSTELELQAEFANCVKNAALILSDPDLVVWRPSLYFVRPERLCENLGEWF